MNNKSATRILEAIVKKGFIKQDVANSILNTGKLEDVETVDGTLYIDLDIPIENIYEVLPMNPDNTISIFGTKFNANPHDNEPSQTVLTLVL